MPAIVRSEFVLALNQVCAERGIEPDVVLESVKAAILTAYRKEKPVEAENIEEYEVDLNAENGEVHILHKGKDVTPPGFGRIAAQTAKQVILQRVKEAEKTAILSDYSRKVGTAVNGRVLRFDGANIIVDIGRGEGVMPPHEQVPNEHYHLNQRLTFYIVEIKQTMRGSEIIVSRAHKGLVSGLFRREVPEIQNGAVEIKEISREAGSHSKVAVFSTQRGVDPVGACVGQKGVRVQTVINELGGMEKIDIIQWSEDVAKFIAYALSPAKDIEIVLQEEEKTAEAIIADDQLSLAIGKEGQNVRLAVKLTGWKIDIKGKTQAEEEKKKASAKTKTTKKTEKSTKEKTSAKKKTQKKTKAKKE
ncbi:transcription termination/antitermination protein NusA [Candidatus Microgenomates bacterium]|nr:transcription termination/antitermination protein NusA [Candidatus Microgenomates bacterium]